MIVDDWTLAHIVLQVITEEGLGHNVRQAKALEDAQARAAVTQLAAPKGRRRGPG